MVYGLVAQGASIQTIINAMRVGHDSNGVGNHIPLQFAAVSKNVPLALTLLKWGADPNNGPILLAAASVHGNNEMIRQLILHGARVNQTDARNLDTPLHVAIREGSLRNTKELLKWGANVNAKNRWGERPFDLTDMSRTQFANVRRDYARY